MSKGQGKGEKLTRKQKKIHSKKNVRRVKNVQYRGKRHK